MVHGLAPGCVESPKQFAEKGLIPLVHSPEGGVGAFARFVDQWSEAWPTATPSQTETHCGDEAAW
jgi:hypothetical protein